MSLVFCVASQHGLVDTKVSEKHAASIFSSALMKEIVFSSEELAHDITNHENNTDITASVGSSNLTQIFIMKSNISA
jgi:methanogenic corrinoid protein MtbC1